MGHPRFYETDQMCSSKFPLYRPRRPLAPPTQPLLPLAPTHPVSLGSPSLGTRLGRSCRTSRTWLSSTTRRVARSGPRGRAGGDEVAASATVKAPTGALFKTLTAALFKTSKRISTGAASSTPSTRAFPRSIPFPWPSPQLQEDLRLLGHGQADPRIPRRLLPVQKERCVRQNGLHQPHAAGMGT